MMLSERIRQARLLAGMTQEALAEALTEAGHSATKAVISKYEMGKSAPKASVLLDRAIGDVTHPQSGFKLFSL
jgi:transcriptional regulator with XRE-family HTH domain